MLGVGGSKVGVWRGQSGGWLSIFGMAMKFWGMQKRGELRKCSSSFALELSIRAGPTHCLALCWQPGAGGTVYRSGWTCGCAGAERAKKLCIYEQDA